MTPAIIGGVTTNDARNALERAGRASQYHVTEWLIPSGEGDTLAYRVVASRTIDGTEYARGFKWDGNDLNALAVLCMALDAMMKALPGLHKQGKLPEQVAETRH